MGTNAAEKSLRPCACTGGTVKNICTGIVRNERYAAGRFIHAAC